MKTKSAIFFALSVAVCLAGATTRIHDSAHSIGTLSLNGGKVNHPALLDSGKSRYTIIATGTVLPPYRGDVRVALEGQPSLDYRIYNSRPVIDLGLFRHPKFSNYILHDLRPKDKIALWVVMTPKQKITDPALTGVVSRDNAGPPDCCETPAPSVHPAGERSYGQQVRKGQRLAIMFYDTKTEKQMLRIPVIFREKGVGNYAD